MSGLVPPAALRWALAVLVWAAVAATVLPAGPLRVAVTLPALLAVPGTALLLRCGLQDPGSGRTGRLAAVVPAVASSAALAAVTAGVLLLTHTFTARRALLVLAVLTTLLVALPFRSRRARHPAARPVDGTPAPPSARPPGALRTRRGARRAGCLAAGVLLAGAAACSDPTSLTAAPRAAAASTTPSAADPPTAPGTWHQVFHDDFTGNKLSAADWTTCYDWNDHGCTNAGNHEQQWYLPGQVAVADGTLALTADRRPTPGSDGVTHPWTSGMVSTGRDSWDGTPRHTFTYGWFAAALQVPDRAEGMFPAFWLIPAESRGTPPEVDIAEFINSAQYVDANLHWADAGGSDTHIGHRSGPVDFSAGYHVFAVDWEPSSVTWYVDGVQRFQVTEPAAVPHVAMELVLDLAVGFQTSPPANVDSARLNVGWVSVWQQ
jgi:beta-glucanase (GH16 family)